METLPRIVAAWNFCPGICLKTHFTYVSPSIKIWPPNLFNTWSYRKRALFWPLMIFYHACFGILWHGRTCSQRSNVFSEKFFELIHTIELYFRQKSRILLEGSDDLLRELLSVRLVFLPPPERIQRANDSFYRLMVLRMVLFGNFIVFVNNEPEADRICWISCKKNFHLSSSIDDISKTALPILLKLGRLTLWNVFFFLA